MHKCYLVPVRLFIPRGNDFEHAYWREELNEKIELGVVTIDQPGGKQEVSETFNKLREKEFCFLDYRFTKEKREYLKSTFPNKVKVFEEIEREILI